MESKKVNNEYQIVTNILLSMLYLVSSTYYIYIILHKYGKININLF